MKDNTARIEKNVPLPSPRSATAFFPVMLKQMEVGDSFFVSHKEGLESGKGPDAAMQSAVRMEIKVSRRRVEGGYRYWRTK